MKNLSLRFSRGVAAVRHLQLVAVACLLSLLAPVAAFATTTPVATIKTKIEGAGADWVEILVAIALVIWAAWGLKLLFKK